MRLIRGSGGKDAEIARLHQELEELQARLEEVTSYYRGELESSQQRLQKESVRSEANEVARRRRAEEQVAYLKGELKAAQSEAEHAKRRYQELSHHLESMENSAEQQAREEVDKFRSAASTAWKSAEEEVERLDAELSESERKLAREQEQRRQVEESLRREKANVEREREKRSQVQRSAREAVDKLRRALKASEQRRKQLDRNLEEQKAAGVAQETGAAQQAAMARSEEQLRAVYAALQHTDEAPAEKPATRKRLPEGDNTVYVDLGSIDLGSALQGELSEEFRLLPSDDSIYGSGERAGSSAAQSTASTEFVIETEVTAAEAPPASDPQEQSPEPARRKTAESAGKAPAASAPPPPARETGNAFGGSGKGLWFGFAAVFAIAVLAVLAFLFSP
jgi:hypothetical protein